MTAREIDLIPAAISKPYANTRDLIGGCAAYTSARELALVASLPDY